MPVPYYPQITITPNLGLSLIGMDEVVALDFVAVDAAIAGISGHPGGTTGQVQYNNAGVFGGLASGVAGQLLTSNGPGVPPSFQPGGGVLPQTFAAVASNWLRSYSAVTGLFTASQPDFTDLSGTASTGQIPNLPASKITSGQLALAQGGTGVDLSASGGATFVLAEDASHVISARALVSGDIPNNAANTSGTAANLSGTPALPNGVTATTQTAGDATAKLATDAFVAAAVTAGPFVSAHEAFIPTRPFINLAQGVTGQTTPSISANQVFAYQFVLPFHTVINTLSLNVQTTSALDFVDFGLYNAAGNLVLDIGPVHLTAGGIHSFAVVGAPITLSAGVYYFAQTSNGTTAASDYDYQPVINSLYDSGFSRMGLAANASVGGQLPSTLGAINVGTQRGIIIVLFAN